MKRLLHVVSFTHDLETTKRFYRDTIGLSVGADTPFMVNFSTDGTGLVLLAMPPSQRREVELCFESDRVGAAVEKMRGRGVEFIDELRHLEFGSVIHFRDPEGNLLSLLQPGSGAKETRAEREARTAAHESAEAHAAATTVAIAEAAFGISTGPVLSTAIVNARDLAAARAYYGHLLGLRQSVDSASWAQYDTGDIRLALYSRRSREAVEMHHMQPVSFGFTVERLEEWTESQRSRGVEFLSLPSDDEGFGLTAEIADPEGNVVVVREPMSEETLEERLAAAWEDDDTPHRTAMRSPARNAERHTSWVAVKPDYKPAKKSSKPPAQSALDTGTGEESAEADSEGESSASADAKAEARRVKAIAEKRRPASRPAVGRQKKAEARSQVRSKRAAADESKSKPVKRAAAKRSSTPKRAKSAAKRRDTKRRGGSR